MFLMLQLHKRTKKQHDKGRFIKYVHVHPMNQEASYKYTVPCTINYPGLWATVPLPSLSGWPLSTGRHRTCTDKFPLSSVSRPYDSSQGFTS